MIQHSTSTPVAEACTAVPHKRRGFTSTLLWKNFLMKRKHPIKWAFEVLIPVALIVLLGGLKTLSDDVAVPEGWSTDDVAHEHDKNGTSYSLFAQETSFGNVTSLRYYQTEATVSGLLLDMATTSWTTRKRASSMTTDENTACSAAAFAGNVSADVNSPYAWPSTCRPLIIPRKLAIIPDNDFTRRYFLQTLSVWYPRVPLDASQSLVIPAITDSVAFFADEASLEAYITGGGYGKNFSTPTIAAAIVFTNVPPTLGSVGNVEYKLRLNSSLDDGGSIGDIPRTNAKAYQPLQRSIQTSEYMHYAKTGFMAYQTLVTRFALCVPDWNTQNKTTTANCTKPTSVMTSSTTSDLAFVAQVQNDPNLVASIAIYMQTTKNSFNLTAVPPTSLSSLAKPLRQMPQPVGGAAVFPMPIETYPSSPFFDSVSDSLGIIFLLSYLHILSSVLVALISEKESKARELMKILGVRDSAIIVSWYITYGIIFVVAAVLQAIASKVMLFKHASLAILFVFFLLFGWTVMSYGYMISAIFSKSRTGTYLGMIGFFAMYLGTVAFTDTSTAESKCSVCILSPAAMTFGIKSLEQAEGNGVGITTSNWTADINNFKFTTALYALMIDCVLYTLLGLYLERVVPKDYGVTEKWFFPLSVSFWRKKFIQRRCRGVQNDMAVAVDINQDNFEPVGAELKRQEVTGEAFQIHNLRRVFPIPGGEKVAVKNVNMTMYKNQITCLLGHNGAGKTTLISMLTGMIPVSSGDATIDGLSLNDDRAEIRESLGMCPQHDVLYAELTVEEHLLFYGKIKGYRGDVLETEVEQKIVEVGLTEKRHVYSSELSGGMKRKLSLAIALLGDSKIVFLDEPTSGMDPYSRRSSWEIILNNRMNRIVVLTTHFMDEADILGDRIAIMAEGELRCCGSSLFLKNRYGAGYNFALVKAEHCNTPALIQFVQRHVGDDTKVLSNVGTEISFQLPMDGSHLFAKMFAELDDKLDGLGVVSYGISVTTLEEVFIKVAEIGDENHQHTLQKTDPSTKSAPSSSVDGSRSGFRLTDNAPLSSLKMFAVHFRALLLKRIRTARRDKRMVIFGTILPIIFVVVNEATARKRVQFWANMAATSCWAAPKTARCQTDVYKRAAAIDRLQQALLDNRRVLHDGGLCCDCIHLLHSLHRALLGEREASKPQLQASATRVWCESATFWLANFAFDLILYAVPCIFGLLAIYFFNITPFTGHDCTSCPSTPFAALVVVFVLFGLAIVPFCYILSYLFVDAPSSQTYVYLINMVLGTILIVVSSVLDSIDSTKDVNTHLKFLWRLSPLFCIGNSLNALSTSTLNMALGLIEKDTSAFSTKVVGWEIAYLVIEAIVFPLVAIGIDYGLSFPKIKAIVTKDPHVVDAPFQVDEDVQAEEQRVAQGKADADAVVMKNLRKVYKGGKVGLVDLSLALPKGECFGYLGINGAGKTTTMKIMTGDVLPTSGAATLGGFDIMTQQLDVRRLIGYCPQFDALIDLLTMREHLELFAAIKGVPIDLIGATVMEKMDQMNLNDFENKLAGTLSGGNKRKLSVAIALIGSPPIIFLDEPSTGMDPVSRRFMWDVIADISTRSKESTILLTTHSMEECEALCTRVGIMVGGRLRCLGSIQHLKNRFGDGLMMHVRVAPVSSNDVDRFSNEAFGLDTMLTKERMDEACAALGKPHRARCVTSSHATGYVLAESLTRNGYIRVHDFSAWWLSEDRFEALSEYLGQGFGSANVQLLERQSDVSRFKLLGTKQTLALSNVFSMIETSKADLSVKEYTVSQTTHEQIFNNFASQQTQETGVARGVETQRKKNAHDNYQAMSP